MLKLTAGRFKNRKVYTTRGPGYRPATSRVRESLFSSLASLGAVFTDAICLDIFAGSGVLGFEVLSRGGKKAYFVEKSLKACQCIKRTAVELGLKKDSYEILKGDGFKLIKGYEFLEQMDLIFIDPPYGLNFFQPMLELVLDKQLLKKEGFLIAEVEKQLEIGNLEKLNLVKSKNFGQTKVYIWQK